MGLKFVTSNQHKVEELQVQLTNTDIEVEHYPLKYMEIQADTMMDVARYSLASLIPSIDGNFLLEDAGLVIESLDGFPGPYSSFVFSTIGNKGILGAMQDIEDRSAKFVSIMALYWESNTYFFTGECYGRISREIRGNEGFGFDPIFIPEGYNETFAQLSIEEKSKISHRSKSITQLENFFSTH